MDGFEQFSNISASELVKEGTEWCQRNPNVRIITQSSVVRDHKFQVFVTYRLAVEDPDKRANESGAPEVE